MRFVLFSLAPVLLMLAISGCAVEESNGATAAYEGESDEDRAKRLFADEFAEQHPHEIQPGDTLEFLGSEFEDGSFSWTVFVNDANGSLRSHWSVRVMDDGTVGISRAW